MSQTVSDQEFTRAWNNSDYQNVMRHVTSRFQRTLDEDERTSISMQALWEALKGHVEGLGQKFTTSLYFFTKSRCLDACRSKKKGLGRLTRVAVSEQLVAREETEDRDGLEQIRSYFGLLGSLDRNLLRLYFLEGKSYGEVGEACGMGGESARRRINKCVRYLSAVCEEADLGL